VDHKNLAEISLANRKNTHSVKWDGLAESFGQENLLPLWVADMDFKVPGCVRAALHQAVDQGAFGYYKIPEEFGKSIITWEKERHGVTWDLDWLRTTSGVVTGLYHLISAITQPGDGVLVQPPVYYPFYRVIRDTGRKAVYSPLREEKGYYTMDWADLEEKLAGGQVKVFLLCSPHNPVGRVWTKEELTRALTLCRRYGVQVVADEIHHDLTQPGHDHVSAASLWEGEGKPITFFSASKTFNLAAMKNSILMIPDKAQRDKFDAFEKALGTSTGSTLDYVAVTAAFQGGAAWLDDVLEEIGKNERTIRQALAPFPGVTVSPLEGTYLLWVDLGDRVTKEELHSFVQDTCGIAPDYGHWFYPAGEKDDTHIRLNLAAPNETIRQAARQLAAGLTRISCASDGAEPRTGH
jgi:cystathionine beta-lyase